MAKIIGFNSKSNGSFINSADNSAMSTTNVVYKRSEKGLAGEFNGSDSIIDTGTTYGLDSDLTIVVWMKPYTFGEGNAGHILSADTNKVNLYISTSNNNIGFTRDGAGHTAVSANNVVDLRKYMFIVITSESDGTTNLYINGVLSGAANQAAGTSTVGVNTLIGNRTATDRTFDGLIAKVEVHDKLLSSQERAKAYNDFLMASPKITEKYPRSMPEHKISDLSSEPNIIAAYNFIVSN